MTVRRPHLTFRSLRKNDKGQRHIAIGARVGYWPCLKAPYLQVTLLFWHLEVWYGLPSYEQASIEMFDWKDKGYVRPSAAEAYKAITGD